MPIALLVSLLHGLSLQLYLYLGGATGTLPSPLSLPAYCISSGAAKRIYEQRKLPACPANVFWQIVSMGIEQNPQRALFVYVLY